MPRPAASSIIESSSDSSRAPASASEASAPAPSRHRLAHGILWFALAAYWLVIFLLTHTPAPRLPKVPVGDKLEHLTAYGVLGTLLFAALWSSRPRLSQVGIATLAIGMAYGAIDEWLQALPFVNRDCDFLDWTADTTGLAIAVIVLTLVRWICSRRRAART